MSTQVIVLNGGSSSGKTGIARCLQAILPQPWLRIGVDDLVDALPPALAESEAGIAFGQKGEVTVGAGFRAAEAAWLTGIAAMGPGRGTGHLRRCFPRRGRLPGARPRPP